MIESRPGRAATRPGVDEALAIIASSACPLGIEEIDTGVAAGRVTAGPIHAARDFPGFDAAAMDGFAVGYDPGATLQHIRVVGSVAAGQWAPPLAAGTATRISTGAPVPAGATAILIQEAATLVESDGAEYLRLCEPVEIGRNIRCRGEDVRQGAAVLSIGVRLTPDAIGALISYGVRRVPVRRVPTLALISTGSELAVAGDHDLASGHIFDSNGPMIAAAIREAGLAVDFLGSAADRGDDLRALIDRAMSGPATLILSTGGVSRGEHDHVRRVLEDLGATILFHGVRMRPGKPMLVARLPDGRLYFGLPGNPVAALVAFRFFVLHAVRMHLGLPAEAGDPVATSPGGRPDSTLFLRGRKIMGQDGSVAIDTSLDQRSHILRSVVQADTWLRIDERDGRTIARAYPKHAPRLA